MTPLHRIIAEQIAQTGPMSVADYMALCLSHPEHGYYATREPFGVEGDFITAPEVSQMFGEMLGLWLASRWQAAGSPAPFLLAEPGPGRGTLMTDILRTGVRVPGFIEAAQVWLIETSPRLRTLQRERLPEARHADSLGDLPDGPLFLVANEFLDALPVRQFLSTAEGWREVLIGLDGDRLTRGLSDPLPGSNAPEGVWRETSPAAEDALAEIARRIAAAGGAALIVDYGHDRTDPAPGFTLQAVRGHQRTDPLDRPGETDLTWLPDFDRMGAMLDPLTTWTAPQGAFLARLGIGHRAAALAAADRANADAIADALDRLTAPGQMGTRFKVLAALPEGAPTPPGFEDSP